MLKPLINSNIVPMIISLSWNNLKNHSNHRCCGSKAGSKAGCMNELLSTTEVDSLRVAAQRNVYEISNLHSLNNALDVL